MLNSVSLVGKVKRCVYILEDGSAYVDLYVKKPFTVDIMEEEFDTISIKLWKGLERMLSDQLVEGMLICVRGRLIGFSDEKVQTVIVYAEVIEILDKHFKK